MGGTGYAAVVFGDHAPTGRLPISLPLTMDDTIEPCGASQDGPCNYTEGMATGYRSLGMNFAYPFGHGITFTEFNFSSVEKVPCNDAAVCVKVQVTNVGAAPASAVPQLYVQFPAESGYPAPVLKGFRHSKVLQPQESDDVVFHLTQRDLSYWQDGNWVKINGFTAQIGYSSKSIGIYQWVDIDSDMIL